MLEQYEGRVRRVREQAGMRGLEGLIIVGRAPDRNGDLLYLCGHIPMLAGHPSRFAVRGRGLGLLFLPTDPKLRSEVVVTTPFHTPAHGVGGIVVNPNIVRGITDVLEASGLSGATVGVVGMDVISAMTFDELTRYNPTVRFVEADDIVMNLRAVKTEVELAALRKGSMLADEVGDVVRKQIVPGVTERQIADMIIAELTTRGVTNAFATCQSGVERSGEPYLIPPASSRAMESGDLVHMEINGRYDGYMIDICRATIVGAHNDAAAHLLETVNRMLEVSIAAIGPGYWRKTSRGSRTTWQWRPATRASLHLAMAAPEPTSATASVSASTNRRCSAEARRRSCAPAWFSPSSLASTVLPPAGRASKTKSSSPKRDAKF